MDDSPDHSEIFEDIGGWDYDVIIMHNSGQRISEKRQLNFKALLQRGVALVVIHHGVCAYEDWPEFRKIAGTEFQHRRRFPEPQSGFALPGRRRKLSRLEVREISDGNAGLDIPLRSIHQVDRGIHV